MTKTLEKEVAKTIQKNRKQLIAIHEEIEDMLDYLDVLEARARGEGKAHLSHGEVKKRYGLK